MGTAPFSFVQAQRKVKTPKVFEYLLDKSNMEEIPQDKRFFGPKDGGCYAEGNLGHQYLRNKLSTLIDTLDFGMCNPDAQDLQESLSGPMPDDAWDEIEAIDILQQNTVDELTWALEGGMLLLLSTKLVEETS